MSHFLHVFFWNNFPWLAPPLWAPPPRFCFRLLYPPGCWGGAGLKNGFGVARVDLMAFTWSTSCLDFWANSGPNRDGETSPKFESSSTNGSSALLIWEITFERRRWLIRALVLPNSLIAATVALAVSSGTSCDSSMALSGARASSTWDWIVASSLSTALVVDWTSVLR